MYSPCPMQIGGHKMPALRSLLLSCHYLPLSQCQPTILTFLFQFTGCRSAKLSPLDATNKCVKFLLELVQTLEFLGVRDVFMPSINTVYNDNMACVNWSKCTTTKGLWHIQMKENRVRESILTNFVTIKHIDGKINLADIFTKEMRDISHFVELCDLFMCSRLVTWSTYQLLRLLTDFIFEGGIDISKYSVTQSDSFSLDNNLL
jgi:hypothetical protein